MESLVAVVVFVLAVAVYFLPTIIAFKRNHPSRVAILLVNLVFGFTVIAWFLCLVWSCTNNGKSGQQAVTVVVQNSQSVGANDQMDIERAKAIIAASDKQNAARK